MTRAALIIAGLYVAGVAAYWWVQDPFVTRDSTYERMCGCPLGLPKYKSAR